MKSSRPSPAGVLAVAGILLGAGVVGFLVHRLTAPAEPGLRAVPTAPKAPGTVPPTTPVAVPAARSIPERLPDFSLPDLQGKPHRLADYGGRPLIVNFWATWCEPCRREIPLLKELRRENSRNSFEMVGIAIDNKDSVRKFVHELGIDYPVLVGEKGGLEAVSAFGMDTVLPFTVFADTQGRIVTLKIGELHRDEASFILERLSDLRTGRIGLAAARQQIGDEIRRLSALRN
ncbi:MAG: redoxin domain-containing protein [Steroidobacteraceae bacterium]